jgi:hypothetical protein
MGSRDYLKRLDTLLLVRRCAWIAAFGFFVVAFLTFPRGLGNLPLRGPDLWGYLVARGEFRWVFLVAVAIAAALAIVALVVDDSIRDGYRYDPQDHDARSDRGEQ